MQGTKTFRVEIQQQITALKELNHTKWNLNLVVLLILKMWPHSVLEA